MDLAIAVHAHLEVLFGLEESRFHDAGLRAGVDRRLDSTLSAIADGSAGRIIGIHRTVVVVAGAAIETDVGPPDDQVAPAEAICSLIGCCGRRHHDLVEVRIPAAVLDLSPALLPVVVVLGCRAVEVAKLLYSQKLHDGRRYLVSRGGAIPDLLVGQRLDIIIVIVAAIPRIELGLVEYFQILREGKLL